jgi:nucleolar protein 56
MREDARESGWFDGLTPGDDRAGRAAINDGRASAPKQWPALAVANGCVADEGSYYEWLHAVSLDAARSIVSEYESADDQQLIHTVRAMDDAERTANELAERVDEWAGSLGFDSDGGVSGARLIANRDPSITGEERLVALAQRVVEIDEEHAALRNEVERTAPSVAPNLSALGGPVLAARLIALAGSLKALARMPSGTVQVLGAEEALFAHLRGEAPSPKHGIIYTHEAVRGTRPTDRGSAARALAGKLTIAARIDHYAGDRRPELEEELAARIDTIQDRGDES